MLTLADAQLVELTVTDVVAKVLEGSSLQSTVAMSPSKSKVTDNHMPGLEAQSFTLTSGGGPSHSPLVTVPILFSYSYTYYVLSGSPMS
jgi:hypothetical protein